MSKLFLGLSYWDWVGIISLVAVAMGTIWSLFLRYKKSNISPDENGLIPVLLFFEREKLESKHRRWVLFWKLLLVAGLIGSIPATKHSISESARLNNENVVLQAKVLELKKQIAPRRLTGPEKDLLTSFLDIKKHNFLRTPGIVVVSPFTDLESEDFSDDFISALQKAGWTVWPDHLQTNAKYGVHLRIMASTPTDLPGLKEIKQALHSIGIAYDEVPITNDEASYIDETAIQNGLIYLFIEHKPIPQD